LRRDLDRLASAKVEAIAFGVNLAD